MLDNQLFAKIESVDYLKRTTYSGQNGKKLTIHHYFFMDIRNIEPEHYAQLADIYLQGIQTGIATFQTMSQNNTYRVGLGSL